MPLSIRTAAGKEYKFTVEVARTPEEQAQGLMNRPTLAPDRGMIFPHEPPRPASFWMKNTLLPLSTAFVADDGRIVNIEDMAPQTLNSHCSREPVRYVLEMNQGWFRKKGIQPGAKLKGPMFR